MWTQSGQGEGGMNWESGTDIYTLPCVKQAASGKALLTADGRAVQTGGRVCAHISDPLCHTAETNTTLYSNYIPVLKK